MKPFPHFSRRLPSIKDNERKSDIDETPISKHKNESFDEKEFVSRITQSIINSLKESNYPCEHRDIVIQHSLPSQLQENGKERNKVLQKWISNMAKKVISASFQLFSSHDLDEKKTKVFCSQNILSNILKFAKKYPLKENDLKIINQSLKSTLSYFLLKYPQTQGTQISKKLSKIISNTNILKSNSNNLIIQSKIPFHYRESGKYNDLIMRFINYIIEIVDQEIDENISLYSKFSEQMEELFESVKDHTWMEEEVKMNSDVEKMREDWDKVLEKIEIQKNLREKDEEMKADAEDYEEKVKSYTKYAIGRKISQNVQKYSENQIQSGNLRIKNPSILRILTKWCEELQENFMRPQTFLKQAEDIILENGQQTNFSKNSKKRVIQNLLAEKPSIIEKIQEIQNNNHKCQSLNNYSKLADDEFHYIEQNEKVLGKFAWKTLQCLETYLISYLNQLIHGLLKASYDFHSKYMKNFSNWPAPPQLITFTIGDLIRCKCSSQEKEIIRIYRELEVMSEIFPDFKIIRVKNRLSQGTKDILINVKYYDLICEIQLGINSSHNQFIYSSDKFNHYIYELKRSIFGPISQMCSIWALNDERIKEFQKISEIPQKAKIRTLKDFNHDCNPQNLGHEDLPFICSICNNDTFRNDKIISNKSCTQCSTYFICGDCQINLLEEEEIKKFMVSTGKHKLTSLGVQLDSLDLISLKEDIPDYGVLIPVLSQQIEPKSFKKVILNNKAYLMSLSGSQFELIDAIELEDEKSKKRLMKRNLIMAVNPIKDLVIINEKIVKEQFLIPQYLKQCYENRQQAINLDDEKINEKQILSIEDQKGFKKITSLSFRGNKVKSIKQICESFTNIEYITANSNRITSLQGIGNCPNLVRLRVMHNQISEIPDEIGKCPLIEKVSFQSNSIQRVSPQLSKLQKLNELWINDNKIIQFPEEICKLTCLKTFMVHNNLLTHLPVNFGDLERLKTIRVDNNKLTQLPKSIKKLQSLTDLNAKKNLMTEIIPEICSLKKIKHLFLSFNKIQIIPEEIGQLVSLIALYFLSNKIKIIPPSIGNLKKLQEFSIQKNLVEQLPEQFYQLSKLRLVFMSQNKLKTLSKKIRNFKNLKQLHIDYNNFTSLPEQFSQLSELNFFHAYFNKFTEFPKQLFTLTKLKKLFIHNNKIEEIPRQIIQLNQLSVLSVENNQIKAIPDFMKELTKLENLRFGNSSVQTISQTVYQLPNLTSFELSATKLTEIPSRIWEITKLKKLDLHANLFTSLPDQISSLKNLITITLARNQITTISPKISELPNLRELNLLRNNLSELPQEFFTLKLFQLNISNNQFTTLSSEFAKLTELTSKQFKFNDNPVEKVECEEFLLEKGSKKSQKWLRKLMNREQQKTEVNSDNEEQQREELSENDQL